MYGSGQTALIRILHRFIFYQRQIILNLFLCMPRVRDRNIIPTIVHYDTSVYQK